MKDIKSMNVCNWKNVAQNRDRWKKVVEQARTLNRLWCFIRRSEWTVCWLATDMEHCSDEQGMRPTVRGLEYIHIRVGA